MLRKFKISIDGQEYLVEMEEIGGAPTQQPVEKKEEPEIPPANPPHLKTAPAENNTSADALPAPMPGVILKVLVHSGEQVKKNQPLLILEAMKMENEIVAPNEGEVTAIHVEKGAMVNPGDPLITIQ